jgi:hypothetical protein
MIAIAAPVHGAGGRAWAGETCARRTACAISSRALSGDVRRGATTGALPLWIRNYPAAGLT